MANASPAATQPRGAAGAQEKRDRGGAAHQDRHLRVDRRLAEPREAAQRSQHEAPSLHGLERERDAGRREDSRPGEVGQREHRVERGQLRHAPVERVGLVAEDDRVTQRLDHVTHAEADRHEEEGELPRRTVLDEVADHGPGRRHQSECRRHPGEMEDHDQRQVEQRGEMPEDDPEHEEVGGRARLRGVPVLPGPRAFPALAHLGEVRVGVVAEIKEAHEDVAGRLDGVGIEVGHRRDDREREAREQGKAPVLPGSPPVPAPHPALRAAFPATGDVTCHCLDHRARLKRNTVHRARLTSPRETFDAPATRSSKRIGTSTIG